jgi:hypothetical protein
MDAEKKKNKLVDIGGKPKRSNDGHMTMLPQIMVTTSG